MTPEFKAGDIAEVVVGGRAVPDGEIRHHYKVGEYVQVGGYDHGNLECVSLSTGVPQLVDPRHLRRIDLIPPDASRIEDYLADTTGQVRLWPAVPARPEGEG